MILALLNWRGSEIILVVAIILLLLGARRLPDFAEGLRHGLRQFRKANRQLGDDMADQLRPKRSTRGQGHSFLMALTLILGAASIILVVYEFSK